MPAANIRARLRIVTMTLVLLSVATPVYAAVNPAAKNNAPINPAWNGGAGPVPGPSPLAATPQNPVWNGGAGPVTGPSPSVAQPRNYSTPGADNPDPAPPGTIGTCLGGGSNGCTPGTSSNVNNSGGIPDTNPDQQ